MVGPEGQYCVQIRGRGLEDEVPWKLGAFRPTGIERLKVLWS